MIYRMGKELVSQSCPSWSFRKRNQRPVNVVFRWHRPMPHAEQEAQRRDRLTSRSYSPRVIKNAPALSAKEFSQTGGRQPNKATPAASLPGAVHRTAVAPQP
jgi:hypothetical protein